MRKRGARRRRWRQRANDERPEQPPIHLPVVARAVCVMATPVLSEDISMAVRYSTDQVIDTSQSKDTAVHSVHHHALNSPRR